MLLLYSGCPLGQPGEAQAGSQSSSLPALAHPSHTPHGEATWLQDLCLPHSPVWLHCLIPRLAFPPRPTLSLLVPGLYSCLPLHPPANAPAHRHRPFFQELPQHPGSHLHPVPEAMPASHPNLPVDFAGQELGVQGVRWSHC